MIEPRDPGLIHNDTSASRDWIHREVLGAYPPQLRDLWLMRPDVARYVESTFRALFDSGDDTHLSRAERSLAARITAEASGSASLASAYRRRGASERPDAARGQAIASFAERLAAEPSRVGTTNYDQLRGVGLSEPALVTLTLLVGFVTYQVRALAGLDALAGAL